MDSTPPDASLIRAREAFLAAGCTLRNERRDFVDWHLGRPRYGLWALLLEEPAVAGAMAAAQAHLGDCLLPGYRRQPHITVALGGFPCGEPRREGDYPLGAFEAALAALRRSAPPPFALEIGGLESFASAPFLAVHDVEGGIASLRHVLLPSARSEERGRDGDYLPHLTVGLYAGEYDCAALRARMADFPPAPLRLTVRRLAFLCYDSADIGGPLAPVADYALAEGMVRCHGSSPFDAAAPACAPAPLSRSQAS